MKIKQRFSFCLVLMLVVVGLQKGSAQSSPKFDAQSGPPTMNELLQVHEKFVYEVKYGFFKLGKVYVDIVGDTLSRGVKTWHLQTIIKSNPGIPFVGREENHYNSLMAVGKDGKPYTTVFWTDNVDEGEYNDTRYIFNRKEGKVYSFEKGEPKDTLNLEEPASSGHIVFYFSRLFAGTHQSYRIPIYISHEKGYLTANNTTHTEEREYAAFDHPVKTYKSEGNADVDGPFGFRGKFTAWFGADSLRLPLEAHVKVWLGHVKVRLIKYTRTTKYQPRNVSETQ